MHTWRQTQRHKHIHVGGKGRGRAPVHAHKQSIYPPHPHTSTHRGRRERQRETNRGRRGEAAETVRRGVGTRRLYQQPQVQAWPHTCQHSSLEEVWKSWPLFRTSFLTGVVQADEALMGIPNSDTWSSSGSTSSRAQASANLSTPQCMSS